MSQHEIPDHGAEPAVHQQGQTPESHYQAIGGAPAVREAVHRLYQRLLADPEVSPYFTGVDMDRLRRHQALMITEVLGGPGGYEGRSLSEAHQPLRITDHDYSVVCRHLLEVLAELGVEPAIVASVAQVLESVRGEVVAPPVTTAAG